MRALQQKLYRQDFRDVDHLQRVLYYTAGSDKPGHYKRDARPTANKSCDSVIRMGYAVDMLNCYGHYNQR